MVTSRTWTAMDIQQKRLTLSREGDVLRIERRYCFVDATGEQLTDIAIGRFVEEVAFADVPQGILTALQSIDTWTYQKALEKEGMA